MGWTPANEGDPTWPRNYKWGYAGDTGTATVFPVSGGRDGRPYHIPELQRRWGRRPQGRLGDDVLGGAQYVPAEETLDGRVVAPAHVIVQTYYGRDLPAPVSDELARLHPGAQIRSAAEFSLVDPGRDNWNVVVPMLDPSGEPIDFLSKVRTAGPWDVGEDLAHLFGAMYKFVWSPQDGFMVWQTRGQENAPFHEQMIRDQWGRRRMPGDDVEGYAVPQGADKLLVEVFGDYGPPNLAQLQTVRAELRKEFPDREVQIPGLRDPETQTPPPARDPLEADLHRQGAVWARAHIAGEDWSVEGQDWANEPDWDLHHDEWKTQRPFIITGTGKLYMGQPGGFHDYLHDDHPELRDEPIHHVGRMYPSRNLILWQTEPPADREAAEARVWATTRKTRRAPRRAQGRDLRAALLPRVRPDSPAARLIERARGWRSAPRTSAASHDGAMVALYVPEEVAGRLAIKGGEPAGDLHVTLAFFEARVADRDDWEDLRAPLANVASETPPMEGEINGFGVFHNDEDVLWAVPAMRGLADLRQRVVQAVEDAGFPVSTDHDWSPHVTLGYKKDHGDAPDLKSMDTQMEVPTLTLVVNDERTEFPFEGEGFEKEAGWGVTEFEPEYGTSPFIWTGADLLVGRENQLHSDLARENGHGYLRRGWTSGRLNPDGRIGFLHGPDKAGARAAVEGMGKTAMADRSGVPEVDRLIEEFLRTPQGDWTTDEAPIEALRDPQNSHGNCEMVTEQFVAFAKERGFRAYVTNTDLDEMGYEPSIEPFGEVGFDENDEMQYGFYPEHTVATVVLDDPARPYGREVYIDFTATQYGYTDHPKVTSAAADRRPKRPKAWARLCPTCKTETIDGECPRCGKEVQEQLRLAAEVVPSGWAADDFMAEWQDEYSQRRPWFYDDAGDRLYLGQPGQYHHQLMEEHGLPRRGMLAGSLYSDESGDRGFHAIHNDGWWGKHDEGTIAAADRAVQEATGFPIDRTVDPEIPDKLLEYDLPWAERRAGWEMDEAWAPDSGEVLPFVWDGERLHLGPPGGYHPEIYAGGVPRRSQDTVGRVYTDNGTIRLQWPGADRAGAERAVREQVLKTAMALRPEQAAQLPTLYHGTHPRNVENILREGLWPRDMVPSGMMIPAWDEEVGGGKPLPGRVYLSFQPDYEWNDPNVAVIAVDASRLDPRFWEMDEDDYQGLEGEHREPGQEAHDDWRHYPPADEPDYLWRSMHTYRGDRLSPTGTIAYRGVVPPGALSLFREGHGSDPYGVVDYRAAKTAGSEPAAYTEDDPLDVAGKKRFFEGMHTAWWTEPEERQRQAIVNALRATMVSPRQSLRNNAAVYQALLPVPPEEDRPEAFEWAVREYKRKSDAGGQAELGQEAEEVHPHGAPGKITPGFWGNLRRLAVLGPRAEELRRAALEDVEAGGTGQIWRQRVLEMQIPGVGPKVASFAWLALAPLTSELGTIDVWMMRDLGQQAMSPRNYGEYRAFERQLADRRDREYPGLPLGQYQWAAWDAARTPGWHQDHGPLRPLDPSPWQSVQWREFHQPRAPKAPEPPEGQMSLVASAGGWVVTESPVAWEESSHYGPETLRQEMMKGIWPLRRPFYFDDRNGTIWIGKPGTHHEDIGRGNAPYGGRGAVSPLNEGGYEAVNFEFGAPRGGALPDGVTDALAEYLGEPVRDSADGPADQDDWAVVSGATREWAAPEDWNPGGMPADEGTKWLYHVPTDTWDVWHDPTTEERALMTNAETRQLHHYPRMEEIHSWDPEETARGAVYPREGSMVYYVPGFGLGPGGRDLTDGEHRELWERLKAEAARRAALPR